MTEPDYRFDAARDKLFPQITRVMCDSNVFEPSSFWQSITFHLSSAILPSEGESAEKALLHIVQNYMPSFVEGHEISAMVREGKTVQLSRTVDRNPPGNMEILTRETEAAREAVARMNADITAYKLAQHGSRQSVR